MQTTNNLNPRLRQELVKTLLPYMQTEPDRHARLQLALPMAAYRQINPHGAPYAFTVHMVDILLKYGEVEPGKHAIVALLEVICQQVGADRQQKIAQLQQQIQQQLGTPQVQLTYCPRCRKANRVGALFCHACGQRFSQSPPPPPEPRPAQPFLRWPTWLRRIAPRSPRLIWTLSGIAVLLIGGTWAVSQIPPTPSGPPAHQTAVAQAIATADVARPVVEAAVADLNALARTVVGPVSGELAHDADNQIESYIATPLVYNFVLEARFYNPYNQATGVWNYGFGFRDTAANQQYRLIVKADSSWQLDLHQDDTGGVSVANGVLGNLDVREGRANLLQLWVNDSNAYFFVNETYIATLDVSAKQAAGTVWVGTGFLTADEITGKSTRYEEFTVWSLAASPAVATAVAIAESARNVLTPKRTPVATPVDGVLEHEPDDQSIEVYGPTNRLENTMVEVRFYNPYAHTTGPWDYGFGFRDTGGNQQYRLTIDSNKDWKLYLHEGNPDPDPIVSGVINHLDISPNGANSLQLWINDNDGYFYVNEVYVATLDLSQKDVAGTLWVGTGFLLDHERAGATTRFDDFAVWSLPD